MGALLCKLHTFYFNRIADDLNQPGHDVKSTDIHVPLILWNASMESVYGLLVLVQCGLNSLISLSLYIYILKPQAKGHGYLFCGLATVH